MDTTTKQNKGCVARHKGTRTHATREQPVNTGALEVSRNFLCRMCMIACGKVYDSMRKGIIYSAEVLLLYGQHLKQNNNGIQMYFDFVDI